MAPSRHYLSGSQPSTPFRISGVTPTPKLAWLGPTTTGSMKEAIEILLPEILFGERVF